MQVQLPTSHLSVENIISRANEKNIPHKSYSHNHLTNWAKNETNLIYYQAKYPSWSSQQKQTDFNQDLQQPRTPNVI